MEILRREFGKVSVQSGIFAEKGLVSAQNLREEDPNIESFSLGGSGPRWSRSWCAMQARKALRIPQPSPVGALEKIGLDKVWAALEIGGDNYSLDYGGADRFISMDRHLKLKGVPTIIWGASIGPFDANPEVAKKMFQHLRGLDGIFVRESASFDYLQQNGVTANVHLVADPAFAMTPKEPTHSKLNITLPDGAIGINLSSLIAGYRGRIGTHIKSRKVDFNEWTEFCCGLVLAVARDIGKPIVLVPHVTSVNPSNDDYHLLRSVKERIGRRSKVPITLLPPLTAAELKWVISKFEIFGGARTHSTIAAISSCVPTLSIGYSLKAQGINRDVFGGLEHCLSVTDLNEKSFSDHMASLYRNRVEIRQRLEQEVPRFRAAAFHAGKLLRGIVESK